MGSGLALSNILIIIAYVERKEKFDSEKTREKQNAVPQNHGVFPPGTYNPNFHSGVVPHEHAESSVATNV